MRDIWHDYMRNDLYFYVSENQVFLFSHTVMIHHYTFFYDGKEDGGDFDDFNCVCH